MTRSAIARTRQEAPGAVNETILAFLKELDE
jgi:hypothetical protein